MSLYPKLAGDRSQDIAVDPQFIIGDGPIMTDSAPALADIDQYELCVLTDTGVTPYVVATHTADALRKMVIAQVAVLSGKQCPFYTAGKFNHNLVVWPASVDTYAERKALLLGTMLAIGHAKPPSA